MFSYDELSPTQDGRSILAKRPREVCALCPFRGSPRETSVRRHLLDLLLLRRINPIRVVMDIPIVSDETPCSKTRATWFINNILLRTMRYREKPESCPVMFRRKLKISLAWCSALFILAAALLVFEVFALLALQFCDGEDLMSLYWSTWTMLQLGSEIAILGINLSLWHQLFNVRQP